MNNSYPNSCAWFKSIQKPVARFLILTMLALDIPLPLLPISHHAQAATLLTDRNAWVTVTPKADPLMQNLNIPANAATQGMWSAPFAWPMNGLHNMILPDGKVLTFGTNANGDAQDGRTFDIWDPSLGFGANSHNTSYQAAQQDSFCSTATYLNDGNMLITGGNAGNGGYGKGSVIYNPVNNSRATAQAVTALPRWYSTMIGLPDGRKLVMGGMVPYTEGMYNDPAGAITRGEPSMTPEIYENGAWRSLFGANSRLAFGPDFLRTSFPHAFVAPNGLVFGISADRMWYLDVNANNGSGAVVDFGQFKPGYGNKADPDNVGGLSVAVMYDIGKIIQAGGNGGFNGDGFPSSNKATNIDINGGAPVLTELPRMNIPRRYGNGIVLANGEVVITGGTRFGNDGGANAVYAAEIWNPVANNWRIGANAATIRVYHSISSLLLNGAIISTGGGTPGPVLNKTGEVYYPPYLFEQVGNSSRLATRPVIRGISGLKYAHGATMQMDMNSTAAISGLSLIALSNGTHSFNNNQRRIPLQFAQEDNRLTATIPNANLTPPGYYQVVALNAQGVPSYANVIAVGAQMATPQVATTPYDPGAATPPPPANVPPTVALTAPAAGTAYTQGATVTISATAADSDGSVAFVDFYDGGTLLGSAFTAPYTFNWVTSASTAAGNHSLTAVAFDNAGIETMSAERNITINQQSVGQVPVPYANWLDVTAKPDPLMDNLNIPADAATRGMWSRVYDWPLNSIHSTLLPNGNVLTFGTPFGRPADQDGRYYDIWNPALGMSPVAHTTSQTPDAVNSFCSTSGWLMDGKLLVSGGNGENGKSSGVFNTTNFAVSTDPSRLIAERWYGTMVDLNGGRKVMLGGTVPYANPLTSQTPEIYQNGQWRSLLGASNVNFYGARNIDGVNEVNTWYYPRAWIAPNGKVFGISSKYMFELDPDANGGTGSVTQVGTFKRVQDPSSAVTPNVGFTSTAVMYAPGKILQVGGNGITDNNPNLASQEASIIDINGAAPTVTNVPNMSNRRHWANADVLPDGKVVVTGGSTVGWQVANAVYASEIWNPNTNTWTVGASNAILRTYHHSTLLLPNGAIFSSGGGAPGAVNNLNTEIYYPPSLFSNVNGQSQLAQRPTLKKISKLAPNYGEVLGIELANNANVSKVALIRTGSTTHSFNNSQRYVPVVHRQNGNVLEVTIPTNQNVAPVGYYMLFVLNDQNVPSYGKVISLGGLPIEADASPNQDTDKDGITDALDIYPNDANRGAGIWREQFNNIGGGVTVADLTNAAKFPNAPDVVEKVANFAGPDNIADNYGSRIRGIFTAPQTGAYTFWVAGDDETRLYLSADSTAANKRQVAFVPGWSFSNEWAKYPEQKSAVINLVAGQNYYLEVLQKEGGGGDGVAVAWQTPSNPTRSVMTDQYFQIAGGTGGGTPTATPPANAITCANENGTCTLPAGVTATVWYGFNNTWNSKTGVVANIGCNNDVFGDPIPGTVKVCQYVSTTTQPPANVAPTVSLTAPTTGTAVTQGATVAMTATAADSDGTVARVEFYDGATLIGTDTTAPYAFNWVTTTSTATGVHSLTARTYDNTGAVTASVAVNVTVNAVPPTVSSTASTPITYEKRTGANNRVWVVNPDNDSVSVLDATTNALIQTIPVGLAPRTIAIAPNGNIWVANKDSATISVISPTTLAVVQTIAMPRASQPFGLAFAPNGSSAFVVLEALGQLRKLDPTNGALQGTLAMGSNPRHVSVTADSATALVSRFITPALPGEGTATVDTTTAGAEVVAVNAGAMTLNKTIVLRHSDKADTTITGSGIPNYLGATAISPDGKTAWVPSKQDNIKRGIARNGQPLNFQNTVRAISSRIDMATLAEDLAARIDHDNASLGSAAVYHPSGNYLFVALETSREVAVLNAAGTQLYRINVGRAPQGLAISADGNTLYVQEFMDRSVAVIDLTRLIAEGAPISGIPNATVTKVVFTVPLNQEKLPANVVLGKQLFYDAKDTRLARDSYMSCASCHNDGGHDGRVWDLTGFGEGLRNTIALKGRASTGHGNLHWSANFDELQDFEGQIRALAGGLGLMSDTQFNTGTRNQPLGDKKAGVSADLDNLAAYVASLNTFAQSPNRNADGTLTAAATAGKAVFANSCASCHGGANFTTSSDGTNLKNIGTINPLSGQRLGGALTGIDVPTLRDLWATAPYLHNGSAPTVTAAVQAHNNLTLNATDLANVVAFVQQIGNEEAAVTVNPPNGADSDGDGIVDALDLYPNDATRGAGIWREQYNNIGFGWTVADLTSSAKYPNAPDVVAKMTTFTSPNDLGDAYGSRMRGIFTAPETGAYTFWVAGDDETRLYLSTDNTAANKRQIAFVPGWSFSNEWTKYPEQKSLTTNLVAGQNYYLEVLHKEAGGGDGIAVAWQTPSNPARTIITDQYFQRAGGTPPPANAAPTVAITAPASGTAITQGATVAITATAADSDGTVARVEFYDGSTLLGTDTTAPYAFSWVTTAATTTGAQSLTARAYDNTGAATTSVAVSVTVNAPTNVAPTVALTAPVAGTAITRGTTVAITATAADSDGTVARVEFYDGATLLGTDTTAPYAFSWVTTAATTTGAHSLTARAYDNTGAATTSAAVSVTVNAVSQSQNLAPSATLATSHVSPWETLSAVNNNTSHTSSADKNGGAYGNWRGAEGFNQTDWVSFSWSSARTLNAFEVYWWNDGLGIATPTEARIEYWNGSAWISLGSIGVALNQYNRLAFNPISTTSIRVLMRSNLSTGILEARVLGY